MAQVDLSIHGRSYQVVCDSGQEAHLRELADFINRRMDELGAGGHTDDKKLLVLALLSIADELGGAQPRPRGAAPDPEEEQSQARLMEAMVAGKLEDFASRIEQVAARLKQT